jgi:DNA invertase Pin-like site-specific DNA recombinase
MSALPTIQIEDIAYSYIRFSHPSQAAGDSLRRQTEAALAWCRARGVRLDESLSLRDLGKSAFTGEHRKNPERHRLAAFLRLVEQGRVARGSYLVIENLDRLSREHIQPALLLALNLLQSGIRIVQLKPVELVFDDKSDTLPVMMMMMELSRGHGESAIKSERLGAAWEKKRQQARAGKAVLTRRLPAWVEWVGGAGSTLRLIPHRAAAVKRIFELAGAGYGLVLTMKQLATEGFEPFGPSGHWSLSYVATILADRRAVGELQPRCGDGTPEGEPIPGYYPPVVTEHEWALARDGARRRNGRKPGAAGKYVNVFSGLLRDALGGESYHCATRTHKGQRWRVLLSTGSVEGRGSARSFPFPVFERAVLSLLAELDPAEVLGAAEGTEGVAALAGELAGVDARIAKLEAELLAGDVAALARTLRVLEARRRELLERLAQARQKAAHPAAEAWGEARPLLALIDGEGSRDARLRLRAALARVVSEVWLLVVPRGRARLAAVQVCFAESDKVRHYLILARPPVANQSGRAEGGWAARSLAAVVGDDRLDLRRPDDVAALLDALEKVDLAGLQG